MLRVGAESGFDLGQLLGAWALVRHDHPDARMWLKEDSHAATMLALSSGALDLAWVRQRRSWGPGIEFWPLQEQAVGLACHRDHPLARHAAVHPNDLHGVAYLANGGCAFTAAFEAYCGLAGAKLRHMGISAGLLSLGQVVAANLAVTVVPVCATLPRAVVKRPLMGFRPAYRVGLAWVPAANLSPPARQLLDWLHGGRHAHTSGQPHLGVP